MYSLEALTENTNTMSDDVLTISLLISIILNIFAIFAIVIDMWQRFTIIDKIRRKFNRPKLTKIVDGLYVVRPIPSKCAVDGHSYWALNDLLYPVALEKVEGGRGISDSVVTQLFQLREDEASMSDYPSKFEFVRHTLALSGFIMDPGSNNPNVMRTLRGNMRNIVDD